MNPQIYVDRHIRSNFSLCPVSASFNRTLFGNGNIWFERCLKTNRCLGFRTTQLLLLKPTSNPKNKEYGATGGEVSKLIFFSSSFCPSSANVFSMDCPSTSFTHSLCFLCSFSSPIRKPVLGTLGQSDGACLCREQLPLRCL